MFDLFSSDEAFFEERQSIARAGAWIGPTTL
jgi:hypothetical protein